MQSNLKDGPQKRRLCEDARYENAHVVKDNHWNANEIFGMQTHKHYDPSQMISFEEKNFDPFSVQRNKTDRDDCGNGSRHADEEHDAVAVVERRHLDHHLTIGDREYQREQKPASAHIGVSKIAQISTRGFHSRHHLSAGSLNHMIAVGSRNMLVNTTCCGSTRLRSPLLCWVHHACSTGSTYRNELTAEHKVSSTHARTQSLTYLVPL